MPIKELKNQSSIIFSCSGKSHLARIGNDIAVTLQNDHAVTMGCIAGIASNIASQINDAKQSDSIIALDACECHCVKRCLNEKGILIHKHFDLSELNKTTEKQDTYTKLTDTTQTDTNQTLVHALQIMQIVYAELNLTSR
ncbi:MAG: putative zinc-binding protein [Cellvibrionaceae bacterium]